MIIGLTNKERRSRETQRREPKKVFIWWPRQLECGRIAFMEIVERRISISPEAIRKAKRFNQTQEEYNSDYPCLGKWLKYWSEPGFDQKED